MRMAPEQGMAVRIDNEEDDTREVIHLETLARRRRIAATRWGFLLVVMMRLVAALWFALGLKYWAQIIIPDDAPLDALPADVAITISFFAVAHLAAAVGLWLATPWGGVLWLLIASAQIFITLSMPGFFVGGYWLIAVNAALILMYFALTFEAGRDEDAQRLHERRKRRKTDKKAARAAKAAAKKKS